MVGVRRSQNRPAAPGAARSAARGVAVVVLGFTGILAGCGGDDEPTVADLFSEAEGRTLSESELVDAQRTARLLCQLDPAVLTELWGRLDEQQLEFQDVVFSRECPDRLALYAEATGRFSTAES